jgi:hypothetical protein
MREFADKYEGGFADLSQDNASLNNGLHWRKHQAAMKAAEKELLIDISQPDKVYDNLNCGKLHKLLQYIY